MYMYWAALFAGFHVAVAIETCSIGSYRCSTHPWKVGCPGFRVCEEGYYCNGDTRNICPPGVYGDQEGLETSACSGQCPPGYFCPAGTILPNAYKCGNASMYCPSGSSRPLVVSGGYYGIGDTFETFNAMDICPKGHYCTGGEKFACPAGRYGDLQGLRSIECAGICPGGWYCPAGTIEPTDHPCGSSTHTYCQPGSARPTPTTLGFYASASQHMHGGGFASEKQCPPGSFCVEGERDLCPAGRYGATHENINASCDGECLAGWYCPPGSILPDQKACGTTSKYCPAGSAAPLEVSRGHYTVGSNRDYSVRNQSENYFTSTRSGQVPCDKGHYCPADGVRRICPAGRYGSTTGLATPDCSGACEQGYYCPPNSTSARQVQCGADSLFCPPASKEPHPVAVGYYTVGGDIATHHAERRCEPGYYCHRGRKYFCKAGQWGGEYGQTNDTCSGLCDAGFYCPEGSTSPQEVLCGEPNRYCPQGSTHPLQVLEGHYSIGGNVSTRYAQRQATKGNYAMGGMNYMCPAGRYGLKAGESSPLCSGLCARGFYCPAGSVSPIMYPCGADDLICPVGSVSPIQVQKGFYTTAQWSEGCKPGTWRNDSLAVDPYVPGNSFIPTEKLSPPCELCPVGTFKSTRGNSVDLCLPCPEAESTSVNDRTTCNCYRRQGGVPLAADEFLHFNLETGICDSLKLAEVPYIVHGRGWSVNTSVSRYAEFECTAGHYCAEGVQYPCPDGRYGDVTRETDPQCTGDCPAGYYCPRGTAYPFSNLCGRSDLYCPQGSVQPIFVPAGYYTTGSDSELTRSGIEICPPGMYCQDGKRFECPRGRYSDEEGTVDSTCKGDCDPGYYCLAGSSSPRQFECGNATVYCPRGSYAPRSVHNGFYCDLAGDSKGADRYWSEELKTCSVELPCEPGAYCQNGDRRLCPPGRFGWRYGLNTSECSGLCAPGYYCPSYLEPQPEAPDWTVWPRAPQMTAFDYKCGDVGWFCPPGAWFPQKVRGGYYSVGGDKDNSTRRGEERCPPGFFCLDGNIAPCPKGRYGNEFGLTDASCSGYCPPGFYCPSGTSEPVPCPAFTYSSGGSWTCNDCPGNADPSRPPPCNDDRTCCFRG